MRTILLLFLLSWTLSFAQEAPQQKRSLRLDDLYQLRQVKDPQRSPDGNWVAFAVSAVDVKNDKNISHLWLASWDGKQERQLTFSDEGEDTPRWSADGRQLAFLSSRTDACKTPQLWLLPLAAGGEAVRLTDFRRDIDDFAWSPDGKRLVLVVEDDPDEMTPEKPEPAAEPGKPKPSAASAAPAPGSRDADEGCALKDKHPKPIEVTRYKFKEDIKGYLTRKRSHLYLLDIETRKSELLTPGDYDELLPAWSPDGKWIAFVSKRHPADPDRGDNWDVFAIEPRAGTQAKQLTTSIGQDNSPATESSLAWSPDSTRVAYIAGLPDPKLYAYDQTVLAIAEVNGTATEIGRALDRNQSAPQWSADGKSVAVLLEDDRSVLPISFNLASGQGAPLLRGELTVSALSTGKDGGLAGLLSTDSAPEEVFAIEDGGMRRLSHQNDKWLSEVQLSPVEDFASRSSDGTEVHGLITKPISPTQKLPALLQIHGGPNGQDQHEFRLDWQLFAANGYAVIAANYRGSSGRGTAFQRAIYADWGHKEVIDLLGAVDHAIQSGLADPARLGIGGWSYGGILTDFTIASDTRFKAATSGAGSALTFAMFGVDEYVTQYTLELGPPWKTPDLWLKLSYPFLHADRISTPTLFLGGDKDFNVPLIGGEQMYQALRELNVPSELVIYPGEFHGIKRPSFRRHRLERYLKWYDRWIKDASPSPKTYQQAAKFTLGGEGGWDCLLYDPAGDRLFIAHNKAILVVAAADGKLLGEIPADRAHGIALVPEKNRGFSSNGGAGTVTVFDLKTLKPIQDVKVGDNPDAILYDAHSKRVIVMNGHSMDLMAIDPASLQVVATVPLGGKPEFADSGSNHIYVNLEDTGEIVSVNAKSWKLDQRWKLEGCDEPSGLALDDHTHHLFAACGNSKMFVVDSRNGQLVAQLPTGAGTDGALFDPGQKLAFAPNGEGTLTVVHQEKGGKYEVVENVPTQRGARTMAFDPRTRRVFTVTAELGPPAEGQRRPSIKPGTFMLLVYAPAK